MNRCNSFLLILFLDLKDCNIFTIVFCLQWKTGIFFINITFPLSCLDSERLFDVYSRSRSNLHAFNRHFAEYSDKRNGIRTQQNYKAQGMGGEVLATLILERSSSTVKG